MTKLFVRILWVLVNVMMLGGMLTLVWGMNLASVKLSLLGYSTFMLALVGLMVYERIAFPTMRSQMQQGTSFNPWK